MESKRGMFSDIEFLNTPYNKNGAFNAFENTLNMQDGMVLHYKLTFSLIFAKENQVGGV